MKISLRLLLIPGLALLGPLLAQAQPANNLFASRTTLTGAVVNVTGSNVSATTESGETTSYWFFRWGATVWWTWTAPASGSVRVDTIGSTFNTSLGIYTGSAVNGLTQVVWNDNAPGMESVSLVTFNAQADVQYQIQVGGMQRFGGQPATGNIQLNLRMSPSVSITSPTNGSLFSAGSNIVITATASTPSPPIMQVAFYRAGSLIGAATNAPFSLVWSNPPLGSNSLYAIVTDSAGQTATSAVVNVSVQSLGATIMSPTDGAVFINTNPITVSVAALVSSGTVTNVEFFVDGQKFGDDASSPFSLAWPAVVPGVHTLTATAQGDNGISYASAPVMIAVARTLVRSNSIWSYNDQGVDLGTIWSDSSYDEGDWAAGPAELGYGDLDDGRPEATVLCCSNAAVKNITYYFRHWFIVTNTASYSNLVLRVMRDDGAVVYLNGTEAARFNMPAGAVTYATLANNASDDGTVFYASNVTASLLVQGYNVLAVELHQNTTNSTDISFDLELLGVPNIPRNQPPLASVVSPTNNAFFLNPPTIIIDANASDADGSVAKVEFYVDGAPIGETTNSPYSAKWSDVSVGWHLAYVVATDDQGARRTSSQVAFTVYDAAATPLVRLTGPANGAVFDGPTNLTLSAVATAASGVTNVVFLSNGAEIGNDFTSPYSLVWSNAAFGSNALVAVAWDAQGGRGTSSVANIFVTIPPTNTVPPTILGAVPAAGAVLTNLTSIQVTFSERVVNVDAADLLVNGVPATQVTGSGSNYTFTVTRPGYGMVSITWAANHGITDIGWPAALPFDEQDDNASWSYDLVDRSPPTVAAKSPPAAATLTNLTQIAVTFSEWVAGVDAADLLINGTPAIGLSGTGSNYTFTFAQPAPGTVAISWDANHGIADLASPPNAFVATGAGATWSYTLDTRSILLQTNTVWRLMKGTAEASSPLDAWRQPGFDDSGWSNAAAPFYYGDAYNTATAPGTLLSDMQGNYSCIFLRQKFVVPNASAVTNLLMQALIDDGFIAWINGVEVLRNNVIAGEVAYSGTAMTNATEPNNNGVPYYTYTLPDPRTYLVEGTNVLTVQAFNVSLTTSTDFGFNAQLYCYLADPSVAAPSVIQVLPPAGNVYALTNVTVKFSEPVGGVDAGDLLVNGAAASGVSGGASNDTYVFSFARPSFGSVVMTWATNHGIVDFDALPKPFNGTAPGSTWQYSLVNPNAPIVASQTPLAGATVNQLTQVTVAFNEPVSGVEAGDLRINGLPATGLSGAGANYTFTFAQPFYGPVTIGWALSHGIQDLEAPVNDFDAARVGNSWTYTLVDQTPPVLAAVDPPAGAQVTNLTQVTVTFNEPVTGINATDLLVNGIAASSVSGADTTYTFSFPQPNTTLVSLSWAANHGIRDLAAVPNTFNANAPNATWSYTTPDTLAPALATVYPPAGATVRSLTQITVTFTEPVTGVEAGALLINSRPARQVSGSGAGPYTFSFLAPATGAVEVRWSPDHNLHDLATPPNAFPGGEWTYQLDPNATFAGKVVIHEIMFNPLGGRTVDEWIELYNTSTNPVFLAGWQFTRGIDFVLPNLVLAGGGYLVVAADVAAFRTKYPTVSNVVGGWTGQLANSDETIELVTALGETVDRVHFAGEGDWARRERGRGASVVESLTRAGSTATVTIFGHGYTANDHVMISGADQPEYNGRFTVSGVTPSTFNITVSGSPASPATGQMLCRQVVDDNFSGWSWYCAADGLGSSMELVNPALPNDSGQNWLASTNLHGTPGRANSGARTNIAPLILETTHFPPVPRSTDPVAITARVLDEMTNGVQQVTLFYRNHTANYGTTPPAFSSLPMADDGTHSDGLAGDGLYGAVLPAATNGAVFEFYVQASDTTGLSRTWPGPAWETNNTFGQLANALYQVDNETITNAMPSIRLVLTGTERAIFPPSSRNGDAEMNATLISMDGDGTKVRYNCGVRVRGAGSRLRTPTNNRLNIPSDNRWNGLRAVNLNCQFIYVSLLGNVISQKSGLPATDAHVIQYRLNGVNPAPLTAPVNGGSSGAGWGAYLLLKPVNGDLAADLFPQDGDGNVYRASTGNHNADLTYQSTNASSYLNRGYFKTSNRTENDWTDLMGLTYAFSQVTPEADYLQAIRTNVNVELWMRYFAVGTLVNFGETAMFNGIGDDYALYRGVKDRRFVALGHDYDTIFGQGDTTTYYPVLTNAPLWIMLNPPNGNARMTTLNRFMTNAAFAPLFFGELKRLCDTTFHPAQFNPLVDQLLTGWGIGPDPTTIATIKTYAFNRRAIVLSQIPLTLTVSNTLAIQNGYPATATPTVTLFGTANAIETRKVLVNGNVARWSPQEARWTNLTTLQPGINRVLVQSLNSNDVEFARATVEVWYTNAAGQTVSGTIATDTAWNAAGGPYNVTASLVVANGATLTIQPGTTVYLGSGVNLTVNTGGRLVAEGTATAPIRFTRAPGTTTSWGGITINGNASSPETRIAYAHLEFNGGTAIHTVGATVYLDHLTFGTTAYQYVSLDSSSFMVSDCVFPAPSAAIEPAHGSGGIKAGGRGIFLRNYFGAVNGYSDVIDFTGGNRPGGALVQFINNVFMGSGDDILDLDGTDAWVEGNIFLHVHKNGSPDTASGVSGGSDSGNTSEVTIIGNLFYDCDHAAMAKQGDFFTLFNNTVVHQTRVGGTDTEGAVVCLADEGTTEAAGMYLEGNIIYDLEQLVQNRTAAVVTFTNNLMPVVWTGPGGRNQTNDPMFKYVPTLAETTNFTSWAAAQVMWDWFSLRTGSPGLGTGPNGRDKGGVVPSGVSLSGEPVGVTAQTTAVLKVGVNCTGSGIPTAGWPNGSGYTHYKWRLDGGAWSAETPITIPIVLSGLGPGSHYVEAVGKSDAGLYQDDPAYGADAMVTVSRSWTVSPNAPKLRLNEILASNNGAVNHYGATPDLIELYNLSGAELELAGLRLTDDPGNPDKFIFPADAILDAGQYLVVVAGDPDGTLGYHLGFNLNQQGEGVYLYDRPENGGALLDSVVFGPQITDLSMGRLAEGTWGLTVPTFGSANRAAALGDPTRLRLNEWLALGQAPIANDFIELYNGDPLPVSLGGLYLSDTVLSWPHRHQMAALSFIAGNGYLRFVADGDTGQGPDHLNFNLNGDQGTIGLYLPDLTPIDLVMYQPQWLNVSQGRSPNGGSTLVFFAQPTPGAANPTVTGPAPFGGALVLNEVLANNTTLAEVVGTNLLTPDWIELYNGATSTLDLSQLSLTDDPEQWRRFVFPAGSSLGAGSYLRVFCEGSQPAMTNAGQPFNTGFGLKASGGSVFLFDASSNLVSAVTYGLQTPNFSIGRSPNGGTNWVLSSPTAGGANSPLPALGNPTLLKINEWMADPASGDDWFELYNPDTLPVALGGLCLTDDLNDRTKHGLAPLSFLGAGAQAWQKFIADEKTGAGADHVNFALKATGEAIGLYMTNGTLIDGCEFGAQPLGVSQGRFPDGSATMVSFTNTASPGAANYRWLAAVAINEVFTHTDPPIEDAIELLNLTGQAVDIGGWWLSDDPATPQKCQIPLGTILPPNGYQVFYENTFSNREIAATPFSLSSRGDEVVLSAATNGVLTGFRTQVKFGAADWGVSFGRYVNSVGDAQFVALVSPTFGVEDPSSVQQFRAGTGAPNTAPRVGPVVISEIMYHPPDLGTNDNERDEFIELHNITTAPVALFDVARPTNVWHLRDAVDFEFPTGTVIQPGDYLLVVSFDPVNNTAALEAFRKQYRVDPGVRLVGPYRGKLANSTDDIELRRPGAPDTNSAPGLLADTNSVPYLLVERVTYADTAPWPPLADGTGLSLQRVSGADFGNDPANWTVGTPTPGPMAAPLDYDGDHLLDAWEMAHGLDPLNPADAGYDSDGDGLTTYQEYLAGTDPFDPLSVLRFESVAPVVTSRSVVFTFTAVANVAYTIEYTDRLGLANWNHLAAVPAAPTNQAIRLESSLTTTSRFFRLRTAGP